MKKILLLLTLFTTIFANSYTYLVDEYTKEVELEAKIVLKIAQDIVQKEQIKLFIPQASKLDKQVYSQKTILVKNCQDANFVFVKYNKIPACAKEKEKFFMTNNYKQLLYNKTYVGAFFWSKSRPNIVLIKNRLSKKNVKLSAEYKQFIEDW